MSKINIFEAVEKTAQESDGIDTLKHTKISLTQELRTKTLSFTVTLTEKAKIRKFANQQEQIINTGDRVTVSDISRELWLMLMDENPSDSAIRKLIIDNLNEHNGKSNKK